ATSITASRRRRTINVEVIQADTALDPTQRLHIARRGRSVAQLPGHPTGRALLALDLHLAGAVRLLRARPEVMVARPVDLALEALRQRRHRPPSCTGGATLPVFCTQWCTAPE